MRHRTRLAFLFGISLAYATPLLAQVSRAAVISVRVLDAGKAPMAGVTLVVLRFDRQASYMGTTNSAGRYTFEFVPDSGPYQIVARKIGYVQTMRLLRVAPGGTADISLSIARLPPQLDTVHVKARALSDDYFINSVMISNIKRPRYNAYDVMRDINPGMLGDGLRDCRAAMNVWVNGRRVKASSGDMYDLPVKVSDGAIVDTAITPDATRGPAVAHPVHPSRDDVLDLIRPQDISEITYHNCRDTSSSERGMRNAIFITLEPGIVFVEGRGSYPADSAPPRIPRSATNPRPEVVDPGMRIGPLTLRSESRESGPAGSHSDTGPGGPVRSWA